MNNRRLVAGVLACLAFAGCGGKPDADSAPGAVMTPAPGNQIAKLRLDKTP